ncbi:DUF5820 family protein [Halobaculum rarum]|uniref:DUF5820 family protein n=1 Tax=Halobaculum rarum TaxID=3075122 RepID=UPI0032AF97AB
MTDDSDEQAAADGTEAGGGSERAVDAGSESTPGATVTELDTDVLAEGWLLWNEEPNGRAIIVFRPDVFDADRFPAPCLPTVYLTNGSRRARPGSGQRRTDRWHVTLFLEPEVEAESTTFDDRTDALDGVRDVTERFVGGAIDYRGAYQVPREAYLDKLDDLIRGE